ncbi:hypothetical protein BRADI_5g27606v3 [Brachypodium distachyon]|uniref:Uncharacterized protein n=1 Tax=Brachypodium distachyon TaxID=15368 RepID=A0A0Q3IGZ7_BRADI|nr:hypothetical protein BRADI_5g27606v3 [Brachypodium distachyon]
MKETEAVPGSRGRESGRPPWLGRSGRQTGGGEAAAGCGASGHGLRVCSGISIRRQNTGRRGGAKPDVRRRSLAGGGGRAAGAGEVRG